MQGGHKPHSKGEKKEMRKKERPQNERNRRKEEKKKKSKSFFRLVGKIYYGLRFRTM